MPQTLYDKIWNEHLVHQQEDGTALLFVDTISSLGSMDYKHDDWGVDALFERIEKKYEKRLKP